MTNETHGSMDFGPIAFALIVASLLFSAAFYFTPQKGGMLAQPDNPSLISVSADAYQDIAPDKAEITFSVESRGADPSAIQAENDAKIRSIKFQLSALGIPEANIKTVGYSLNRWTEYNKSRETYDEKGYVLENSLRVVTYDVSQSGSIIAKAVLSGANTVSGVQFGLADATREKAYSALLSTATATAKEKASSLAKVSGVKITTLQSLSESYSYVEPYSNVNYRMAASEGASDVSISGGTVKVRATVSASYKIE